MNGTLSHRRRRFAVRLAEAISFFSFGQHLFARRIAVCLVTCSIVVLSAGLNFGVVVGAEPGSKSDGWDQEMTRRIDECRSSVVAVGLFQVENGAVGDRDLFLDWVEREPLSSTSLLELGSGVIIDGNPETHRLKILTHTSILNSDRHNPSRNNSGSRKSKPAVIFVKGANGPGFKADVIGADPGSGLAVLQTEPIEKTSYSSFRSAVIRDDEEPLPMASATFLFCEPQSLIREGENAVSLSHIRRHGWTGYRILNDVQIAPSSFALERERFWLDRFPEPMIAGSPVFRIDGTLVGIASPINGKTGADWSLEVIPVSTAYQQRIINELSQGYEIEYGFLGLQLGRPNSSQLSAIPDDAFLQGERVNGASIVGLPDGALDVSETLAVGDIIIAANDWPVRHPMDLVSFIGQTPPGELIQFKVWRMEAGAISERIRVGKLPLKTSGEGEGQSVVTNWRFPLWRGLRVNTTLPEITENDGKFSCHFRGGVVVTHVTPGSSANIAGIKVNDLIEQVGEREVNSPADFYEAANDWTGEVPLTVSGRTSEVRVSQP